jgi:hypothetical protein
MVGGYPGPQDSAAFFAQLDATGALLDDRYYGGSDVAATMYAMDAAGCDYVITGFLAGKGAWVAKVDSHGDQAGCSLVHQATVPVLTPTVTPIPATFTAHAATVTASSADAAGSSAAAVAGAACP